MLANISLTHTIPLNFLSLKISGARINFSDVLDAITGYAKVIEVETNAKNNLTFKSHYNGP